MRSPNNGLKSRAEARRASVGHIDLLCQDQHQDVSNRGHLDAAFKKGQSATAYNPPSNQFSALWLRPNLFDEDRDRGERERAGLAGWQ